MMPDLIQRGDSWILYLPRQFPASPESWVTAILNTVRQTHAQSLIIDLTNIETIDTRGLSLIITLQKVMAQEYIVIALRKPNRHLCDLFRIMQFDHLFIIDQ
ncbi:MAG: STAS domain-containing protein [Anaerolineae bacterium]|nr:STAS domain-containing protein [Anaerolineae bacterium]